MVTVHRRGGGSDDERASRIRASCRCLAGARARARSRRCARIAAYVVLIAVALAMFVPFVFSLATSLKTNVEANNLTWATMLWPANPTLDAYRTLARRRSSGGFQQCVRRTALYLASWPCPHRFDGGLRIRADALSRPRPPLPGDHQHLDGAVNRHHPEVHPPQQLEHARQLHALG